MTAIEMQIRYWERELADAERCIELYEDGSRLWENSQKRYENAMKKMTDLTGKE